MKTTHQIFFKNAQNMHRIPEASVDLVVTSPPYPMIEMWDDQFGHLDRAIKQALTQCRGPRAFELMHRQLDPVWKEVYRILKTGGIACINIGDATRTLDGFFALYPNHARIMTAMLDLGFCALPEILWRKQTNAPNKFMGSGMLPPGAYVTLEHEFILVLRKGPKREFSTPGDKQNRHQSAFFWEERNIWYSDVWMDLKGTPQKLADKQVRLRSGAYPFELPYRIINMFSVKGDTVVDPFLGLGTTMLAAMAAGRNSLGFELESGFKPAVLSAATALPEFANALIASRLKNHLEFVRDRIDSKGPLKYTNCHYQFPVVTNQEKALLLNPVLSISEAGDNTFEVTYAEKPQAEFCRDRQELSPGTEIRPGSKRQTLQKSHIPAVPLKQRTIWPE